MPFLDFFKNIIEGRGISFSRLPYKWMDASLDRCLVCNVFRDEHGGKLHRFRDME